MCAVLQRIASLANGLSKAELHVLLALAVRAEAPRVLEVRLSSRELARQTGLARSSVQEAIDSLNQKVLIRSNAATNSFSSVHFLICLASVETEQNSALPASEMARNPGHGVPKFEPGVVRESGHGGLTVRPGVARIPGHGGPESEPVVARNSIQGGPKTGPGVAQPSGQGGSNLRPPHDQKSTTCEISDIEYADARVDSIEKDDFEKTIDRLRKAQKSDYDPDLFELARNQIASHHAKFARPENRIPNLPDDRITAQFLAVAEWPKLSDMLSNLASERKEAGHSYAWYLTVALQRVHGISPQQVRDMRTALNRRPTEASRRRHDRRQAPSNSIGQFAESRKAVPSLASNAPAGAVEEIRQQIRAMAAKKGMF